MNETTILHNGHAITAGFVSYSFYAKCGSIYEGGYLKERSAINAVKRRLNKRDKERALLDRYNATYFTK